MAYCHSAQSRRGRILIGALSAPQIDVRDPVIKAPHFIFRYHWASLSLARDSSPTAPNAFLRTLSFVLLSPFSRACISQVYSLQGCVNLTRDALPRVQYSTGASRRSRLRLNSAKLHTDGKSRIHLSSAYIEQAPIHALPTPDETSLSLSLLSVKASVYWICQSLWLFLRFLSVQCSICARVYVGPVFLRNDCDSVHRRTPSFSAVAHNLKYTCTALIPRSGVSILSNGSSLYIRDIGSNFAVYVLSRSGTMPKQLYCADLFPSHTLFSDDLTCACSLTSPFSSSEARRSHTAVCVLNLAQE